MKNRKVLTVLGVFVLIIVFSLSYKTIDRSSYRSCNFDPGVSQAGFNFIKEYSDFLQNYCPSVYRLYNAPQITTKEKTFNGRYGGFYTCPMQVEVVSSTKNYKGKYVDFYPTQGKIESLRKICKIEKAEH